MAYLVELLLPLSDNEGHALPPELFTATRTELIDQFGGLTAFLRSPASGAWRAPDGAIEHDAVVVFEVMTDELDRAWWGDYRRQLEGRFQQKSLIVRCHQLDIL